MGLVGMFVCSGMPPSPRCDGVGQVRTSRVLDLARPSRTLRNEQARAGYVLTGSCLGLFYCPLDICPVRLFGFGAPWPASSR